MIRFATCCHPLPGDRIVGIAVDKAIEVLAEGSRG